MNYTLMHKDTTVMLFSESEGCTVLCAEKLPYSLRNSKTLTATESALKFDHWLSKRVDNLSRTYMNKVYILRKIGRDREQILKDSCAVSISDCFWVKRDDVQMTWEELKSKRDLDINTVNTALTGEIAKEAYNSGVSDSSSLFTLKGNFPKAVYQGNILKKGCNAEYEAIASSLGKCLGISVQNASIISDSGNTVSCEIFTSDSISLAHANELFNGTVEHEAVYDYFKNNLSIRRQLERLFLFNYIVCNDDLHEENYGFLFDNETFEVLSVANAYDFNSAFTAWGDTTTFYPWIVANLPSFAGNNKEVCSKLGSIEFENCFAGFKDILTSEQIETVLLRAKHVFQLTLSEKEKYDAAMKQFKAEHVTGSYKEAVIMPIRNAGERKALEGIEIGNIKIEYSPLLEKSFAIFEKKDEGQIKQSLSGGSAQSGNRR